MRRKSAFMFIASALLLATAGGEGQAGSPPPPHPPLSDCQAVWDDSDARDRCTSPEISTRPGKCRIKADCRANDRRSPMPPRQGCRIVGRDYTAHPRARPHYFKCITTIEFSPNDTDAVSSCDGQLRRGSSC